MPIEKPPSGTRGAPAPKGPVIRVMTALMTRVHRLSKDKFRGSKLTYLTTVGAKSGKQRTNPVMRFDDGHRGWFVVASANGASTHPGWYHNVVADPESVWAEVDGRKHRVTVEQLAGAERDHAWTTITAQQPGFLKYLDKTDRTLPVLRLTPRD